MRASLPTDGIGMQAPPVADVAASVDTGIGIQNFFVPTLTGRSNSIGVSGNRCGIDREENCRTGFPLADEGENAVINNVQKENSIEGGLNLDLRKIFWVDFAKLEGLDLKPDLDAISLHFKNICYLVLNWDSRMFLLSSLSSLSKKALFV